MISHEEAKPKAQTKPLKAQLQGGLVNNGWQQRAVIRFDGVLLCLAIPCLLAFPLASNQGIALAENPSVQIALAALGILLTILLAGRVLSQRERQSDRSKDQSSQPQVSRGLLAAKIVSGTLIGLVSFFALAGTAPASAPSLPSALVPSVDVDQVEAKQREWKQNRANSTDTLLLGSSQIYRHLIPSLLETEAARLGHPTKAYNFGVPGMHCLELAYLTDWILESKPSKLKRVVLHCQEGALDLNEANWQTTRTLRWHDDNALRRLLGWYYRHPDWAATWKHLAIFLRRSTNVGEGSRRLAHLLDDGEVFYRQDAEGSDGGFLALDQELRTAKGATKEDILRRQSMVDDAFMRRLKRWNRNSQANPENPFDIELMAEIHQSFLDHGVEPYWLLPPKPRSMADLLYAEKEGLVTNLIRLDQPQKYPKLFERSLRFDRHHLTEEGARILTKLVAQKLFGSN